MGKRRADKQVKRRRRKDGKGKAGCSSVLCDWCKKRPHQHTFLYGPIGGRMFRGKRKLRLCGKCRGSLLGTLAAAVALRPDPDLFDLDGSV